LSGDDYPKFASLAVHIRLMRVPERAAGSAKGASMGDRISVRPGKWAGSRGAASAWDSTFERGCCRFAADIATSDR
jgi:hypothetical protein